jgi:hypothetical protein
MPLQVGEVQKVAAHGLSLWESETGCDLSVSDRFRPDVASLTPGVEALGSAPLRGPLVGLRGGWGDRCGKPVATMAS